MLHIRSATNGSTVTLSVAGRLTGPWVEELRRLSESALAPGRSLELDLSDLMFVDLAGAELLRQLSRRGVALLRPSTFVHTLIEEEG